MLLPVSGVAGGGRYGVFGHGVAHTGSGVESSPLPPDVPQGMGARAKLLAGHVGGPTESVIFIRDYSRLTINSVTALLLKFPFNVALKERLGFRIRGTVAACNATAPGNPRLAVTPRTAAA